MLCGPHGVGKTHLAVALTAELSKGHQVYYARVQQLMYRLQSSFQSAGDSQETFDTLYRAAADAEVLVLDDLGAENDSEWTRATLHELLSPSLRGASAHRCDDIHRYGPAVRRDSFPSLRPLDQSRHPHVGA